MCVCVPHTHPDLLSCLMLFRDFRRFRRFRGGFLEVLDMVLEVLGVVLEVGGQRPTFVCV